MILKAFLTTFFVVAWNFSGLPAAEKVRFASHIRAAPLYALPIWAALDHGFWKQQGLEAEYLPFESPIPMNQAVVVGAVDMGVQGLTGLITAIVRGVPVTMVADPITQRFLIWVRSDSRIREPKDLRGARVSITRFGADLHYALIALGKDLGIEKEMKIIAAGGVMARIAAIKAGATDATIASLETMAHLVVRGEIRELLAVDNYIPKGVFAQTIFASRGFLEAKPDAVKKGVKGFILGADYVMKNRDWAIRKMMTELGFSEEAARIAHQDLQYTDGRTDTKRIDAAINFLVEYGLLAKDKVPPMDKIFVRGFVE